MCWAHDAEGKDKENDQSRESHRGAPSRGHYLLSTEDTHSLREMQRTRPNGPIDPGHLESTRGQRQRRDKTGLELGMQESYAAAPAATAASPRPGPNGV